MLAILVEVILQGIFSYYRTVISDTNCPVAPVPAPPAVRLIVPEESMVPARSPAEPAAVLVWLEKALTAPTVGALVIVASPAVYAAEKENASPAVACEAVMFAGAATPFVNVPRPPRAPVVVPSEVEMLLPEIL